VDRRFEPTMPPGERERLMTGWHRAVERSKDWADKE
jgi:glycerol kinase